MNTLLQILILFIVNLKTLSSDSKEPVRLAKNANKKKRFQTTRTILPIFLLGIGVATILFLLAWIILHTGGSMESTAMYNQLESNL